MDVPVWCLKYNSFTQKLLSIKHDNQIQIWDCTDLIEKVQSLTEQKLPDTSKDFARMENPTKEFPTYEVNGLEPSAICGSWLSTDHNMFVVAYEGGHLAFYDVNKGTISQQHKLENQEITCLVTHSLEPAVVLGTESGDVVVYDQRTDTQLKSSSLAELEAESKPSGAV